MQTNITRRSMIKGTAALAGAAALGSYDISHPAGAIAEDAPEEIKYTYCDMCNHVPKCGIACTVKDGKVVHIESREGYPASPLCAKGLSSVQELYDPERITTPMIRTNAKGTGTPEWAPISWDEAYERIASELNRVKEEYGPEKVFFYCGDPKEPRGAMQRLATLFGSPNYGVESSCCASATWITSQAVIGNISMGTDPSDASNSALVWSLNPAWSQPYRFSSMMKQKERGCKFVVVDPRITPTVTGLADIHLQLRPGTDGALAAGWLHIMFRDNMYDVDFAENWTTGLEELKAYVADYTPERVESITGVPADKLEAAVKMIWENSPSTLVSSSAGGAHQTNVGHYLRAVFMIISLMGSLDIPGGLSLGGGLGFDYAASTPNFNGVDIYAENNLGEKRLDKDLYPVWAHYNQMIQMNALPEFVANGDLKAAVLLGANAMMLPQTPEYQKAIGDMEFSVAIDYYMRPWTHDYVDILLPAAMPYERMAPFAVFGRKIFLREPVVKPAGEAREDFQILLELGCKLGYEEECFHGSVEAALESMLVDINAGITLDDLRAHPEGITIEGPAPESKRYETGAIRKDGKPGFNTLSGKVELVSGVYEKYGYEGLPVYEEPVYSPLSTPEYAKDYPLVLNSGGRVPYYTHSKLRGLPWLNQFMPEPVVRLHPKDAAERGLVDGDDVRVFNHLGEIFMKVEVTNMVLPGVVDIFHGWAKADVNLLISRDFCPITGFPPFRAALCQVEKI